jgi:UDP-4-amino-4,6-dideoxy-N-acetyl-beta-L-altrosamine N-acetyltransferase
MIRLRDVRSDDRGQILKWRNSPEVANSMFTDHQISLAEHELWFTKVRNDTSWRLWIIVCDDEDVGFVYLCDIDHTNSRCYWSFYVARPDARGKGVGSFVEYSVLRFVFDELKLNKLCGEVLASNEAILALHRSFGLKHEGVLREHVVKQGVPRDVVCVAMLRREWESIRPQVEDRLRKRGLIA